MDIMKESFVAQRQPSSVKKQMEYELSSENKAQERFGTN